MEDFLSYFQLGYTRLKQSLLVYWKSLVLVFLMLLVALPFEVMFYPYCVRTAFLEATHGMLILAIPHFIFLMMLPLLLIGTVLSPLLLNMWLILIREHLWKDSGIRLSQAFTEARSHMEGRWLGYYVKSFAWVVVCLVVGLVLPLVFPFITALFVILVMQTGLMVLAYQSEVTPLQFARQYLFRLIFLLLVMSVFLLFAWGIVTIPALFALPLFVVTRLEEDQQETYQIL